MTTNPVWIGLGSNLGDRRATLDGAVLALSKVPGVVVQAVSRYHETQPVGGPPGQGPFLNAAARLDTTLSPHELLSVTQTIEDQAMRTRAVRWSERTLDIDLLIYGSQFLDTPELKLPHPRMAFRRFVLVPLVEIAPDVGDLTTRWKAVDLLANLDHRPLTLALDGPTSPLSVEVFSRLVDGLPGFQVVPEIPFNPMPNFVVALPGSTLVRRPKYSVPTLWPESDDPEAIVAEVLALCRGIEAI